VETAEGHPVANRPETQRISRAVASPPPEGISQRYEARLRPRSSVGQRVGWSAAPGNMRALACLGAYSFGAERMISQTSRRSSTPASVQNRAHDRKDPLARTSSAAWRTASCPPVILR